jgi:hypothetical protein
MWLGKRQREIGRLRGSRAWLGKKKREIGRLRGSRAWLGKRKREIGRLRGTRVWLGNDTHPPIRWNVKKKNHLTKTKTTTKN